MKSIEGSLSNLISKVFSATGARTSSTKEPYPLKGVAWFFVLVAMLVTTASWLVPSRVSAASKTWNGSTSSDWSNGSNWSGGTAPASTDDVTIPSSGVTNQPTISSGDVTIRNLTIAVGSTLTVSSGRTLTLDGTSGAVALLSSGTITGSGTFQTQGTVKLDSRGSFSAPLSVSSGTTAVDDEGDGITVYDGTISVASGATLDTVQSGNNWTVIANADVTVNPTGTLSGLNKFRFKGATLTNGGNVSVITTDFNRNGDQSIAGAGTWTGSNINIGVSGDGNATDTSLVGTQSFAISGILTINIGNTLTVNNSLTIGTCNVTNNGTISVSSTLTYNPSSARTLLNSGMINGGGTFQTQGTVKLNSSGSFSASLSVSSGTTEVDDESDGVTVYDGTISVASGATLDTVQGSNNWTVIANADVTVNPTGTLSGLNKFRFKGATLTNDGNVSVITTDFNRNGAQSIAGAGTWTGSNINIGVSGDGNATDTSLVGTQSFSISGILTINIGNTLTVNNSLTIGTCNVTNNGTISVSSTLTYNPSSARTLLNFGMINGGGTFQTQGTVKLNSSGSFSAPLSVSSGTTTIDDESDGVTVYDGTISVASGATLDTVQGSNNWTVIANADVTVNPTGTLSGLNKFRFKGATLTNDGNVSVITTDFNRNGAQSIAGSGTWTGTNINIGVSGDVINATTTSLANAVTFAVVTVTVHNGNSLSVSFPLAINGATFNNNSGCTVALGAPLTFNGGVLPGKIFNNVSGATVSGSAALQTQGIVKIDNRGSFSAPLSVSSGTTTVDDEGDGITEYDGAISVASGATLDTVQASNNWTVIANADVTVGGTLSGLNKFRFNGATLTNNGTISVTPNFEFNRAGAQTLTGTGAFVSNTARVISGSTVTLGSDHQMSTLIINGGGAMDITSRTLSLSGAGTPLTNNSPAASFITTGSTVVYDGAAAQTAATTNVFYNNLTINNPAGVSLTEAKTVPGTLTLTNGIFSNGANLTMGNDALISRSNGLLTAAPTFGATVNVEYTGSSPITTGPELPAGASVLNNLTMLNSNTVTLSQARAVNGALFLTNGSFANGANLTMAAGTTITRDAGTLGSAPAFAASVNLNYTGATGVTSGPEIPISSATLNNLTIDKSGGVTLSASAAVNGTFTLTNGVFAIGSNTLTLNSAVSVTGGSVTSGVTGTVNYNQQSNGQSMLALNYGNLTFSNFNKMLPASGTIRIAGAFTSGSAAGHIIAGSTIEFNGASPQALPSGFTTYNNLTLNNPAGTSGFAGLTVNALLRVQAGTFTSSSTYNNVQIDGGASLAAAASTINIGGNWTNNGSFTAGTGSVNFNGSAAQSLAGSSATMFNNLTINNGAGVSLGASATVNGDLTLASGALSIGANTLAINGAINPTSGSLIGGSSSSITFGGSTASTALPGVALRDLTLNRAAGISLGGDVTVGGTLALTIGDLTTGAFTLTMPGTATATGSADVVGSVRRTGFAIGTPLSFGNPFNTVSFASGTLPTDVTVNLIKSAPSGAIAFPTAINRTYTISPTGGSGFSATVRLHYLDSDLSGNNEAMLSLWRFDGTNWHKEGKTANDTADNWVEKSGVTAFSPWTLNATVPTDVTLLNCAASGYDGGVFVQWQTGFEVDNLGFNVYRERSGSRELVNTQMIAGSALVAGSGVAMRAGRSYAWWDGTSADCRLPIAECQSATYWLEDLDINGKSTMHGPFVVKAIGGKPPAHSHAALLSQIGEAKPIITAQATSLPLQKPSSKGVPIGQAGIWPSVASGPAVKLGVREEGWYRVTQSELIGAGLDARVDPRYLQLYLGGVEQALLVTGESDRRFDSTDVVEFYAKGLDTPSSDTHVYWLVSGKEPGKRINIIPSHGKPGGGRSFSYTVERKERSIYFPGLLNGEAENFFGRVVASQPVEQSLTLQHIDTTSSAAEVEVALQGVTDLGGSSDHQISVALNGGFIGRMVFDGRDHKVQRFSVYATLLKDGENSVTLTGQSGSDITLVDYVRVIYDHTYAAEGDELKLTANMANGASQTIEGFSTPLIRVMDVSDPSAVQELAGQIEPGKGASFAVTVDLTGSDPRTLTAFADGEIKRPASITANQPSSWRSANKGADMVMITGRELAASLEPLRALRQSQGLSVAVVHVEDIYDEFNFGEKTAQSLKDLIGYAVTSWKKKPRYVLLAGDASFDSRNYLGFGDNDIVPTRLIDTQFMETASDEWLADLDNDGLAEVAVGRLPVRTAGEASKMAAKIVGYERSSPSEEVLLVSDESSGYDFEAASGRLMPLVPANLRVNRIDRGRVAPESAKKTLLEAIYRGQKIVNYTGHGSVDLWSGSLLTGTEALGLENGGHLSLFVMMTCLNGYFQDAVLDSLGEALMKAEGGAVSVWTSTGMTVPLDQWTMNEELYRVIFGGAGINGQPLTIGEAAARAKARITDSDIRRTWVLLGDPAMKLK